MTVSYLEIYNETINDLLDENNKELEIRTRSDGESFIQDLTEEEVSNEECVFQWLDRGESVRKVAETKLNEVSSRSHTIFIIKIELKDWNKNSSSITSEIYLVDLAGSESVEKTQSEGIRFREGASINKSLLALSNIIQELSKNGKKSSKHISYRSSKLTRILQKALGGNSKTTIIWTLNQIYSNQTESINTLKFGGKAKMIKSKFSVNQIFNKGSGDSEYSKYLESKNDELKEKIKELEEEIKYKYYNPISSIKAKCNQPEPEDSLPEYFLQEQIVYLESMVNSHYNSYIEYYTKCNKLEADIERLIESFKVQKPLFNRDLYEWLNNDDMIDDSINNSVISFAQPYDKAFSGDRLQKTARYSDDYQQLTKELNK